MRQCVLSVPHGLRYRMAYDADLLSPVMRIFSRVVFQSLRKRASEFGIPRGQCGAVTFVQRFGSALNLHPHGHSGVRSRPRTLILKSWNSSSSIETPSVFTWKAELGCWFSVGLILVFRISRQKRAITKHSL